MTDEHATPDEGGREQALRRLLTEAVEPVVPGPGAQARLLAKAQAQQSRGGGSERGRVAVRLRWAGAVLAAAAVLVAGGIFVAGRTGDRSTSSVAGSSASSATAGRAVPQTPPGSSSEAAAGTARSAAGDKQLSLPSPASTFGSAKNAAPAALGPLDLEGDGAVDTFTLRGNVLSAQLSTGGTQTVTLPGVGAGARVVGISQIDGPSGQPERIVVVELRAGPPASYAELGLRGGRLTLLRTTATPP